MTGLASATRPQIMISAPSSRPASCQLQHIVSILKSLPLTMPRAPRYTFALTIGLPFVSNRAVAFSIKLIPLFSPSRCCGSLLVRSNSALTSSLKSSPYTYATLRSYPRSVTNACVLRASPLGLRAPPLMMTLIRFSFRTSYSIVSFSLAVVY